MKHLKKFENQTAKNVWLMGDNFVSPNVLLIGGEVEYNAKAIPQGVSIQHIDGTLYTMAQWVDRGFANDAANGVAIADKAASFVIAKTEKYNCIWASDTSNLIEGVTTIESSTEQTKDYAGYANTQAMLSVDTSGAAFYCDSYIFPNGARGYLPSMGEWKVAYKYASQISEALNLIGADQIGSSNSRYNMWSSTQYDATNACVFDWPTGTIGAKYGVSKSNNYMKVRPFALL